MEQRKKQAVVTLGIGVIGSQFIDELVERGDEVHAINNLSAGKKGYVNSGATLHIIDICNIDDGTAELLRESRF